MSFRVRIDEAGVPVGTEIVNSANVGYISETTQDAGAVGSPDVITRVRVPDLAIAKSHEGDFEAGARVPFELVVSDVGDGTANGRTTVTDALPPELRLVGTPDGEGWACDVEDQILTCTRDDELAPGAAWPPIRFTAVVRDTARPRDLVNTGRVSNPGDGNELNDTDTETGEITPSFPDLAIDKRTLTPVVFPGDDVRFRISVTNLRPRTATRVRVRDVFPAGLTPLSLVPSRGSCGLRGCRLGRIREGEVVTIEVAALAGLDTGGQTLRNRARVSGREDDINPDNNRDTARVRVIRLVDLVVTKDAAAPSVPAGGNVSFVVTVRNEGPSTATRVRLRDVLPDGLTPVSLTPTQGGCSGTACSLGTLPRGASAQIEVVARSTPAMAGQTVLNTAFAIAREPERDLADNLARAPVSFTDEPPPPPADIVVTKEADRQQVTVGDIVGYRVTVVNRGPGDAANVHLTDSANAAAHIVSLTPSQGTCSTLPPVTCDLGPLAAGARATIEARVQILAPGPLRNAVTAIAPPPDPTPGDEGGTAGVSASNVSLRKRAGRAVVRPGQTVTFRMTATSRGNVPAEGVRVCDRLPDAFTFVSLGGGDLVGNRRACWTLGRLEGSRTVRLVARATGTATPLRVTNVATVTATNQAARRARARVRIPAGSGLACPKGTSRPACP